MFFWFELLQFSYNCYYRRVGIEAMSVKMLT